MITKEYIQNFSRVQEQIDDLVNKYEALWEPLRPIIKQYCKIENILVDSIDKIQVDIGEIHPSYIHVTYSVFGYRGSPDEEYTIQIPVSFFINENAIEELKAKRESEKNITSEKERQRKIVHLKEQMQSMEKELLKLNLDEIFK